MRVGIDARSIKNRRGIGNVVYHLLHGLSRLENSCSFFVYVDDKSVSCLIPSDSRFTVKLIKPKLYPFWEQISLPLIAMRDRLDVLHCPGNSAPILIHPSTKLVITIHDVMYLFSSKQLQKSPLLYQRFGRLYLKWVVPIVAKRASKIITVSSVSRNDIYQYISIPTDRVSVIWSAANEACKQTTNIELLNAIRIKFNLGSTFLLALGALDPRKNTANIIKAFALLKNTHFCDVKLAIVGLDHLGIKKYNQLADDYGISSDVVFTGFVLDSELVALYNAADCLLYPSLYEGFGLPVLEAMACGTPVITSACGSIPEIAGDAALMVDPHDLDAIAAAMMKMMTDKELYNSLVQKGKRRAELFSWQLAAEQTFAVYDATIADK
jgi:glycosyltransferase involved in cell wall biosynthesis